MADFLAASSATTVVLLTASSEADRGFSTNPTPVTMITAIPTIVAAQLRWDHLRFSSANLLPSSSVFCCGVVPGWSAMFKGLIPRLRCPHYSRLGHKDGEVRADATMFLGKMRRPPCPRLSRR